MSTVIRRRFPQIPSSEITAPDLYHSRRRFLQHSVGGLGALAASSYLGEAWAQAAPHASPNAKASKLIGKPNAAYSVLEKVTPYNDVTSYNNFYEFGTDKADPAIHAHTLQTRPWAVRIEGLVKKPITLDVDALLKLAPIEERIYRLRCVEGWSMVVPWLGYSLSEVLKKAEPLGSAKFVEFVSLADPKQMPGVTGLGARVLNWPYREGLRLDEALHPLTLLTLGLYGEVLPKQNGAPVRIVTPWKYGFKSAKSIVAIRLTEAQPKTSWQQSAPQEYGFYSNVNPEVDHPRWSQATEKRIGEGGLFAPKRKTLMFNGYGEQVASLYRGMDLKKWY